MFLNFPDITNSQTGSLWETMLDRYLLTADNMSHDEISDEGRDNPLFYPPAHRLSNHGFLLRVLLVLKSSFAFGVLFIIFALPTLRSAN